VRPSNAVRIALFLLVAVAVAVTANLVLLGIATGPGDPVGRLSPKAGLVRLPPTTTQLPATTTAPVPPATTTAPVQPATTQPASPLPPRDGERNGRSRQQDD
jgi:hypothetical protein